MIEDFVVLYYDFSPFPVIECICQVWLTVREEEVSSGTMAGYEVLVVHMERFTSFTYFNHSIWRGSQKQEFALLCIIRYRCEVICNFKYCGQSQTVMSTIRHLYQGPFGLMFDIKQYHRLCVLYSPYSHQVHTRYHVANTMYFVFGRNISDTKYILKTNLACTLLQPMYTLCRTATRLVYTGFLSRKSTPGWWEIFW